MSTLILFSTIFFYKHFKEMNIIMWLSFVSFSVFEMSSLIDSLSKLGVPSVIYHVNDIHKLFIDLTKERTMFKPLWNTIVCFNMIVLCRYECARNVILQVCTSLFYCPTHHHPLLYDKIASTCAWTLCNNIKWHVFIEAFLKNIHVYTVSLWF
jgi:hypothetical protein